MTPKSDSRFNVFQAIFVCGFIWVLLIAMGWMLSGCITPPPVMMKPDIVEIEIPVPVMAPFDCTCQCQPHKTLEIVIEDTPAENRLLLPGTWEPLREMPGDPQ